MQMHYLFIYEHLLSFSGRNPASCNARDSVAAGRDQSSMIQEPTVSVRPTPCIIWELLCEARVGMKGTDATIQEARNATLESWTLSLWKRQG